MRYQPLSMSECKTASEMNAVYTSARKRLLRGQTEHNAVPPPSAPSKCLPEARTDVLASVLTLAPVEDARISAASIFSAVATAYGYSVSDLKSPRRATRLVSARQHAMALLVQFRPDLTYTLIGRLLNRDHATIMHGNKQWPKIAGKYRKEAARIWDLIGLMWTARAEFSTGGENFENALCPDHLRRA